MMIFPAMLAELPAPAMLVDLAFHGALFHREPRPISELYPSSQENALVFRGGPDR